MNKNILKAIGAVVLVLGLAFLVGAKNSNLGGNFNPVTVDFAQGISVNGTQVINSSGTFLGAISATGTSSISGSLAYKLPVVAPAGDATLTVAQSGSFVKMNTAGEDITLPAVASSAGVHYKFAVTGAVETTNMTIASAEGDNIEGSLIVAGAVVDCDANDVITFVIDGENIGDFVELYSDGTSWLIGASGGLTASKMTCSG